MSSSRRGSAQSSAPVPAAAPRRSDMRGHTGRPTPTPTLRKDTQAHAPDVSTLFQAAPSLYPPVQLEPALSLRPPTNTSNVPPPQPPQPSRQDHRDTPGILPRREHPPSSQAEPFQLRRPVDPRHSTSGDPPSRRPIAEELPVESPGAGGLADPEPTANPDSQMPRLRPAQ
jgi:hypothetical protein